MIHYHLCYRCTHEWTTSCMGDILEKPNDRARHNRQRYSNLCWDCFEQLEAGEIRGLEIFNLYIHLDEKREELRCRESLNNAVRNANESRRNLYGLHKGFNTADKYSLWDVEHGPELHIINNSIREIYFASIVEQRTPKRIELAEFQEKSGCQFFGPQPKPEGFKGDPPGKVRFSVLFGLDPLSGDIIAPTIVAEDGNGRPKIKHSNHNRPKSRRRVSKQPKRPR